MLSIRRLGRFGSIFSQHHRSLATHRPGHFPSALPSDPQQLTCRVKRLNTSQTNADNAVQSTAKFGSIELASAGWKHHKAKGDHFTIHPAQTRPDTILTPPGNLSFDALGLDERLVHNVRTQLGNGSSSSTITRCTIAQARAVPQILAGNHTLLAAETGCGKTLAYLMPIVHNILQRKQRELASSTVFESAMNSPQALVLTPGRELASQIAAVAGQLCHGLDINVQLLLGGRTKQIMLNPTFAAVDLLVGTMGATSKLVTSGVYRMHQCEHVVLDEADTLLDDSFNPKLTHFLKRFPFHRNHMLGEQMPTGQIGSQLILTSATMPTNVDELLQTVIDPSTVHEVLGARLHRMQPHIEQRFVRMSKTGRPVQLLRIVRDELARRRPVIVFCNQSATSDYLSLFLAENGVECANLNGDMPAALRVGKFERFQTGDVDVLSTTDMASRGLDTTRARHIVNFDVPLHMADYIHRIGRTGRLGGGGGNEEDVGHVGRCIVTNFVSSVREIDLVQRIEHAARTNGVLPNVNANITNIIKTRIMHELSEEMREVC